MRKYSVVDEEGVVRSFTQRVGEADHSALNDAIDLAQRAGEDVIQHHVDAFNGDALASAGWGTDEDYGGCNDW